MTSARLQPKFALSVIALVGAAIGQAVCVPGAFAQDRPYPYRVVRFITSLGGGAGADGMTRAIGEQLSRTLGQQFIVDARPGAGGNIAAEFVTKATPDGYTLWMSSLAANAIQMSYTKGLSYDLRKDYVPISKFAHIANGIFVGPSFQASTLAELTAMGKAAPGKLSCASSGTGGLLHLTCEMYKKAAGVDALHVPYKSSVIFLPEITVGAVSMVLDNIPIYVPMVKSGRIKALAVTTTKRSPVLPDVPTAMEQGVNMDSSGLFGLLAPAGTPREVVQLLNRELAPILNNKELREKLLQQGIELEHTTPEAWRQMIDQEIAKWARVIQDAGLRPN
jgi:tripartite-type tricarboxylate transporter receptor subunit TctC